MTAGILGGLRKEPKVFNAPLQWLNRCPREHSPVTAFLRFTRAERHARSIQSAEFSAINCSLFEVLRGASTPDRSGKPA
jgi:hypothetical protein